MKKETEMEFRKMLFFLVFANVLVVYVYTYIYGISPIYTLIIIIIYIIIINNNNLDNVLNYAAQTTD